MSGSIADRAVAFLDRALGAGRGAGRNHALGRDRRQPIIDALTAHVDSHREQLDAMTWGEVVTELVEHAATLPDVSSHLAEHLKQRAKAARSGPERQTGRPNDLKAFTAESAGRCSGACRGRVEIGEKIVKHSGGQAHEECAR